MNKIITVRSNAAAGLACLLAIAAATPALAFGSDDYLSSIGLFGGDFCPKGTLEAAGQIMPINQNQALFSLYGTTYGGDGITNFALPNLSDKAPAPGMRYCVLMQGIFPSPN